MQLVPGSERIVAGADASPVEGRVRWAPAKSLWIGTMTAAALTLGPLVASWDALLLFVVTSGLTLCFGHSVGMHRRLIHASFECPLWLEYACVYPGTLVRMAGPIGMTRVHDFRDWAQLPRLFLPPAELLAGRVVAAPLRARARASGLVLPGAALG